MGKSKSLEAAFTERNVALMGTAVQWSLDGGVDSDRATSRKRRCVLRAKWDGIAYEPVVSNKTDWKEAESRLSENRTDECRWTRRRAVRESTPECGRAARRRILKTASAVDGPGDLQRPMQSRKHPLE